MRDPSRAILRVRLAMCADEQRRRFVAAMIALTIASPFAAVALAALLARVMP